MPLGPLEILLVVLLLLLLFGASRLPQMARELGQGIRGFKDELSDGLNEDEAESEKRREREVATPPRAIERH
jgi:sec-independent protein translocase protein TatA